MQPGDVQQTYSDMSDMIRDFDYLPKVTVREGVARFMQWFKEYYKY